MVDFRFLHPFFEGSHFFQLLFYLNYKSKLFLYFHFQMTIVWRHHCSCDHWKGSGLLKLTISQIHLTFHIYLKSGKNSICNIKGSDFNVTRILPYSYMENSLILENSLPFLTVHLCCRTSYLPVWTGDGLAVFAPVFWGKSFFPGFFLLELKIKVIFIFQLLTTSRFNDVRNNFMRTW